MTLALSAIAPLDGPRPAGSSRRKRVGTDTPFALNSSTTRRRFLKGAVGVGVGVSIASLRLFPLTEPAFAGGYDIYQYGTSGPCSPGNYAEDDECNPGCNQSSTVGGTSCNDGVCGDCWHRCCGNVGPNGATHYLRPDQCWQNYYDGWHWQCSSSTTYRCHDGTACWYGGCGPTICRINV